MTSIFLNPAAIYFIMYSIAIIILIIYYKTFQTTVFGILLRIAYLFICTYLIYIFYNSPYKWLAWFLLAIPILIILSTVITVLVTSKNGKAIFSIAGSNFSTKSETNNPFHQFLQNIFQDALHQKTDYDNWLTIANLVLPKNN
jgi:hypothetical protein